MSTNTYTITPFPTLCADSAHLLLPVSMYIISPKTNACTGCHPLVTNGEDSSDVFFPFPVNPQSPSWLDLHLLIIYLKE